jgi:hypothetical protein
VTVGFAKDATTHSTPSTSDPTPIVEFAAELGDQVGWMFWVRRLDQMVIVVVFNFLGHAVTSMLMRD